MRLRTVLLGLAALALSGSAVAQTSTYSVTVSKENPGFQKVHLSKATLGASEIRLWANSAIDPDCRAMDPPATLSVVQAPAHGAVRISDEPFYAAFPPNNPRSACNKQKIPGHQAFYKASPDFHGHDFVVLQGSSPEGHVSEITVDVEVR